jgi:hypothetical protein
MPDTMKIIYMHKRHISDADGLDADKVFADDESTRRIERAAMIDGGGLREGDTLYLRALSDLGQPSEAGRLKAMIERMGVAVQVIPMPPQPKPPRPLRKVWLSPDDGQKDRLCTLWFSSLPPGHVLERAKDVMGRPVSRAQMNRLCGPRDGSNKKI